MMYQAGFFSFIFLIVLLFLGIRILLWLLFPNFFARNSNQGNRNDYYEKKEGDINIDYIPKKSKKIKNETGDYTDYEEMNDA